VIQPSKTVSKEITISNFCEGKEDISVIRTKTTDDQQRWLRFLVQHAKDHLRLVIALQHTLSESLLFFLICICYSMLWLLL
jgi:branched-subunit amino acid transport protein AzlD